jgi:homoserine/homoserine lactone efflux protein
MVKWIGAAYLVWIGHKTFRGKSTAPGTSPNSDMPSPRRLFTNGFVLQASNPKALLYFTAILPQFIDPHGPIARQILVLATTSFVIEFSVLFAYGALAGRLSGIATPAP